MINLFICIETGIKCFDWMHVQLLNQLVHGILYLSQITSIMFVIPIFFNIINTITFFPPEVQIK